MIRRKLTPCVELTECQNWAFDCDHFAQTGIMVHQLGRGVVVTSVLKHAHIDAGLVHLLDGVLVEARLCALVLRPDDFTGDFVRRLKVLGENIRVHANVTRGLWKWSTDVDRKAHFPPKHETGRREAGGLRRRGAVSLENGG